MPDEPAQCPKCHRSSDWMVLVRSHRTLPRGSAEMPQELPLAVKEDDRESGSEASEETDDENDVQIVSQDFPPLSQSSDASGKGRFKRKEPPSTQQTESQCSGRPAMRERLAAKLGLVGPLAMPS